MKNLKFSILILGGFLALTVCNHLEITPPAPISPKGDSGYTIEEENMLFIWSSVEDAIGYGLQIAQDEGFETGVITNEQLTDTSALVSLDMFSLGNTYYWRVRAEGEAGVSDWSDEVSFTYTKDTNTGTLDLDTTYFPFGLGYEWCYEAQAASERPPWVTFYTFTVQVTDSFWISDTLCFYFGGKRFLDVHDTVRIWSDSIVIGNWWWGYWDTTTVVNPEPTSYHDDTESFRLFYNRDTLISTSTFQDKEIYEDGYVARVARIKGIGGITELYEYLPAGYYYSARLLYFYNGEDTVYKAD